MTDPCRAAPLPRRTSALPLQPSTQQLAPEAAAVVAALLAVIRSWSSPLINIKGVVVVISCRSVK
jgi:hypothetical protein